MFLRNLGIFGWKEPDENLILASLLTGDPLLLIGPHGSSKTHVFNKIGQALMVKHLVYDASKSLFEDVLGFPNVEKLKHGVVEYVSSPVTIWDKEFVLIDELNRAIPELQSKWLEIIRSRKIMGFETAVKWVWAAMNPISYSATNALDAALIGRFAFFVYPPDVLSMSEEDRINVALHINGEDAPSLAHWTDGTTACTVQEESVAEVGENIQALLRSAGKHFLRLREQMSTLAEFLAKFADLLVRETKGEVAIDGRRLGFIQRNLVANRAVELAKAELFGAPLPDFVESAKYVVQSSIPVGLNGDEALNREEAVHKFEICFDLLSDYFSADGELQKVNLVYELFTVKDLMRKAELLLTCDLGELALSKAWADLMAEDRDITLLAYTALQVEARRPGTVPQELLASLAAKVETRDLTTGCIDRLQDDDVEYVDEVEQLLAQDTDLGKLVAFHRVSELVEKGHITLDVIERTRQLIEQDIQTFESLITAHPQKKGAAA